MIKSKIANLNIDKILVTMSILYLVLPIIIFAFGWLKIFIATPIFIATIYFIISTLKSFYKYRSDIISYKNFEYWIIVLFVIFIWVHLSGVGSMTYQNSDYWARNPMYRDLINLEWPIIFDLSKQSDFVKEIVGTEKVAYSYYFSYWLTPAFICKIFSFLSFHSSGWIIFKRVILELYSIIGIFLVFYNINRYLKKNSYITLIILIFFSGFDYLGNLIINNTFPLASHIEWWAKYFQYSSNTTLLFWVFNQTIPVWLISILFLQADNKQRIAISALSFAFSPWATIGFIPFALGSYYNKKLKLINMIKNAVSIENIIIPSIMLLIYGSFYTCGTSYQGESGIIFLLHKDGFINELLRYFLFIILEVIIIVLFLNKNVRKETLFIIMLVELLAFPIFKFMQFGFTSRGSIPALFFLMIFCIKQFLFEKNNKLNVYLAIVLLLGSLTPLTEINRTLYKTAIGTNLINESVYSFDSIKSTNEVIVNEIKNLYFRYDYQESFFFKYLAKK